MREASLGSGSVSRATFRPAAALLLGCIGAAGALGAAGCVSLSSDNGTGTGGKTGGVGGGNGAGGAAGVGGAPGAGGQAGGTGGAPGVGGAGNGAGGTNGTGGGNGSGGITGAGGGVAGTGGAGNGAGGGGVASCASLPLCDDFETGASPGTLWTLVPTSASGSATIDTTMGAHGSSHSLKVVSPDRLYLRNSTVIGTLGAVVHVRFYVRFSMTLPQGHGAMIVTHPTVVDQYTQQNELRFGSQDMVFHWNTDADSANIPIVGPGDASSFKPAANTWYCIELTINSGNSHLNVSIDGTDAPGLTEDGVATPNIDDAWVADAASKQRYMKFGDFNFGWQSYGAGAMTLWFDDVALSPNPIGCAK